MGFELFVVLDLNTVACALGMGFFSLGSSPTVIFFSIRSLGVMSSGRSIEKEGRSSMRPLHLVG